MGGPAYVCALVGDVWALINPLKTIFEWADRLYRLGTLKENYPSAVVTLTSWAYAGRPLVSRFAWVEIVYGESAIPSRIAQLMVAYSLITWAECSSLARTNGSAEESFLLGFGLLARFARQR